jgi:hypothetical protein
MLDETERGNTLLFRVEDGSIVAWINLPDGGVLEVSFTPDNYPSLTVATLDDEAIRNLPKHIAGLVDSGWTVRKDNHSKQEAT